MKTRNFVKAVLIAVCLCVTQSVAAQASFGFRAGANVSKMQSHVFSADNRGGFFMGAVLEVKIPVIPFGFDIGAFYDIRRAKIINIDDASVMRSNMQFASLPFNVRCPINLGKHLQVAASTGPQCDFALGSKNILHDNFRLNDATWSWNFGGAIRILKHYQIGYTYNVGITRVAKILPNANIPSSDALRNNSHQVYMTYFF